MDFTATTGGLTLQTGHSGVGSRYISLAVFGLLLASVLTVQYLSGALGSELVDPDEPAHFISGLLVRDFVAGGLATQPLDFARDYYAHYPKVAIGNWPPFFHALEGAWLLILPAHPASVLVLLALITSALACLIFMLLRRSVGITHALFGAGMFVLMRPVPTHVTRVMIEMPMALATTFAVWLFARYMVDPRPRWAAGFAAACIIAVLTKGNAVFLALLPPLVILMGRRWSVLRRPGLWYAALVVVVIAGPWTWYFLSTVQAGWRQALPSIDFMSRAAAHYSNGFLRVLGPVPLVLAAVGLWDRYLRRGSGQSTDSTVWLCAVALIPAVIVFHLLVPAGIEQRHMIPAYPALAMLVAAGTFRTAEALQSRGVHRRLAAAVVIGVAALAFALQSVRLPMKVFDGYGEAAAMVIEHAAENEPVTALILSDVSGEGAFVVEIAIRDRNRPSHTVWRGTTLLARATWAGRQYRLRADDDAGVIRLLEQASIQLVIMERRGSRFRHYQQIDAVITGHPDRFSLISEFPVLRAGRLTEQGIAVYEFLPGPAWTTADAPVIRQVPGYDGIEPR